MAGRVPRRRRARSWFVGLLLLAAGAAGAYGTARHAVPVLEQRTLARVQAALDRAGADWAEISVDGLTLRLTGRAPNELQRIRALALATGAAGLARIDNRTQAPRPAETAPPPFRFEVLRSEHGTAVIGLVPLSMDSTAALSRLEQAAGPGQLTDLLEQADHPAPEGWNDAVGFAIKAAAQMPRAKVAVTPGRIRIDAVTDGEGEKARLEQALAAAVPPGVTLVANITAPRPAIAPFLLELVRTPDGTRLDRCAADNQADLDRILAAAAAAGVGAADCPLGLGTPSPHWADAAVAGIAALDRLAQGRLTIRDLRVALAAPHGVSPDDFAAVRDDLAQSLPPGFTLDATLAPPPVPDAPRFVATRTDGGVRLRGTIADRRMGDALDSLAAARFGGVDSDLSLRPDAPPGWTGRVLAALDAVDLLQDGAATVTPDLIRLTGTTGNPAAAPEIADRLAARLGAGAIYELSITYDPSLDPAVDRPSGTGCVDALNATMQQSAIGFEPNNAEIAGDAAPVIAALGDILAGCRGFRLEIGGHTDSQGSDSVNLQLSADRARAVRAAMDAAGIDTSNLTARGYGDTRPLAPNDSPAGREANRRIEFRLLSPEPARPAPLSATTIRGVTGGPPPPAWGQPDLVALSAAQDATGGPASGGIAESRGDRIGPGGADAGNAPVTGLALPPLKAGGRPISDVEVGGIHRPPVRPED